MKKLVILPILLLISPQIFADKKSASLKMFEQMQHQHPGCPINSICSKESAKKIKHWEEFIEKLGIKNKNKKLEAYRVKHGLPIEFLTTKESQVALDPVLWNSRCKQHNPKNPHARIYRAQKFLRNNPKSEHVVLDPVTLFEGGEKVSFSVPYGDKPALIKNGNLVFVKDYDDFYFQLSVTRSGKFKVEDIPAKVISSAFDKRIKDIKCPIDIKAKENKLDPEFYMSSYCEKIWDMDTNTLKIVRLSWACP